MHFNTVNIIVPLCHYVIIGTNVYRVNSAPMKKKSDAAAASSRPKQPVRYQRSLPLTPLTVYIRVYVLVPNYYKTVRPSGS